MNNRSLILLIMIFSCALKSYPQVNKYRRAYEDFKCYAQKEYSDFREQANKRYAEFMCNAWENYKTFPATPRPIEKEVPPGCYKGE